MSCEGFVDLAITCFFSLRAPDGGVGRGSDGVVVEDFEKRVYCRESDFEDAFYLKC